MLIVETLRFVETLQREAPVAESSSYTKGYHDALNEVTEFIREALWDQGVDEEEE